MIVCYSGFRNNNCAKISWVYWDKYSQFCMTFVWLEYTTNQGFLCVEMSELCIIIRGVNSGKYSSNQKTYCIPFSEEGVVDALFGYMVLRDHLRHLNLIHHLLRLAVV